MTTEPTPSRRAVVGAAVLRDGRVLAARRTTPPELAGRWELPGGKVESGESHEAALCRELTEELGLKVTITSWLPGTTQIGSDQELHVAIAAAEGEPRPIEHDRIAWLAIDELGDVDWLDSDRPFLNAVRQEMSGR